MNKRDWLRSQGFHVGERGRLTPAMLKALERYDESPELNYEVEIVVPVFKYISEEPLRESRQLYGRKRDGSLVSFSTCAECNKHMSFCSCQNGILAPIMVISTKEKDVRIGTAV